ncbi:MAG: hypothetical protein IJC15_01775 [Clostridia bacterium]|nr:hypothetical protein [Clostridia bacterium]
MKKTSIRMLCALLLCTMLPIGSIACAGDAQDPTSDTTAPTVGDTTPADTTASDYDSNGFWKDDLPSDLKFTGETINMLTWADVEHEEFTVENLTGETVNDAIYNRNQKVEDRLGVTLSFYGVNGDADQIDNFVKHVGNAIQAGSREFDMIGVYSLTGAALASNGYLLNLLDLPYLNFEQPWWPERLLSEATINDKLFFASGDISANSLYMMYTCFFNKEMLANYSLPNPQELVQNNEWTYEKFFQLCEGVYVDLNGNQQKDEEDQFGYMSSGIHVDPWFYGAGNLLVEKDTDGNLIPSPTFSSEKVVNIIAYMNSKFWDTDDSINTSSVKHQKAFAEKRILFCIDRARCSMKVFSSTDVQYGIVPSPKYDAAQESYVTVMGNPFSLYCLPIDCRAPEMLAAVMECYASESYRQVTPALFEITLKVKYSDDAVSAEMYDLIRENLTFDIGRIFSDSLIGQGDFRNALKNNQNAWASVTKVRLKQFETKLKALQKAFE